jgi:hypothetical protein
VSPDRGKVESFGIVGALKNRKAEAYAFERALGTPPRAAARAVGYADGNGQPTKLETKRAVVERIAELRKQGFTDDMLAAKRSRVDERLGQIAFGIARDFETVVSIKVEEDGKKSKIFHPDLPDWGNRLNAINQLRDMHGFKGAQKIDIRELPDEERRLRLVELARKRNEQAALSA